MLDQEDLEDFTVEVEDYRRRQSWSTDTELLATCVDMLGAIASKLDAGIKVGIVDRLSSPKQRKPIERPEWVRAQQKPRELVMHPRDFMRRVMQDDNK